MEAVKETTGGLFPAHTYLLDGTTLVAYIKTGETDPYYFKSGIKGFSKSGRKFELVKPNPFVPQAKPEPMPWIKQVQGSKPNTFYQVNTEEHTCTCPGYTFRGACKHVKELVTV
jgi:hypothetical protein